MTLVGLVATKVATLQTEWYVATLQTDVILIGCGWVAVCGKLLAVQDNSKELCEMKPTFGTRLGIPFTVLTLTVVILSCSSDNCMQPEDEDQMFTDLRRTPEGLIQAFCDACNDVRIDRYDECLDLRYKFFFMPGDLEDAGVTPEHPYWEKAQDVAGMNKVFTTEAVDSIAFVLEITNQDTTQYGSGVFVDIETTPDIKVMVQVAGSEPVTYWAHRTRLVFTVVPDNEDEALWRVLGIEERGVELYEMGRGPEPRVSGVPDSFGRIKAMFRAEDY